MGERALAHARAYGDACCGGRMMACSREAADPSWKDVQPGGQLLATAHIFRESTEAAGLPADCIFPSMAKGSDIFSQTHG